MKQVNCFRGYHDAVLNVSTGYEPSLVNRNDSRSNGAKSISNNFGDDFELEVDKSDYTSLDLGYRW